jgi:hypothetical protein
MYVKNMAPKEPGSCLETFSIWYKLEQICAQEERLGKPEAGLEHEACGNEAM